jgi:PAS domain S-box-containing protein
VNAKASCPPPSPDGVPEVEAVRILLIEDSPSDRRFFTAILCRVSQTAFSVTEATSLAAGLERLAVGATDLVLLDLGLPDSWGLETFMRLHAAWPRVPVIVLTGSDDEALAVQAVRAGAQDFLVKGQVDAKLLGRAIRYARERHRIEVSLRESEERYRDLVENLNEIVCVVNTEGVVTYISPVVEQVGGYRPAEILGCPFGEFIHPADREMLLTSFQASVAGHPEPSEFRVLTKSGALRWMRNSSRLIQVGHRVTGLRSMLMDITDRKRAEEEIQRLNASLEQRVAERTVELTASNRELEAFCYSVSHDLRGPLRGIDGFCRILIDDHASQLDAAGRGHLERVRWAAQRMAELIDDLLDLSQLTRREMDRQPVDLSTLARTVADRLQRAEQGRSVTFVIAGGVSAIGDERLLRVVIENLLGNAWKYTSRHAAARIEFGAIEHAGQRVYFVRDDGAGFDMDYVAKLFQPFQRLHGATEFDGAGIGLATVERIIRRHGGRVWAEGAIEQGATVYFTLDDPGAGA